MKIMGDLLIIESDQSFVGPLVGLVRSLGHRAYCADTLLEGVNIARRQDIDLVFINARMPDGHGMDALPLIVGAPSNPEVIVIASPGDPEEAETAILAGAWDYIEKPPAVKVMRLPIIRALQYRAKKTPPPTVSSLKRDFHFEGVIGKSPPMKACFELMVQAADSEANVLLSGETGTGKEVFAEAIHSNSRRDQKNFVIVDCAALPETLVESTLFGHVKGAFTSADATQDGLVKQADGGTLFLDEIGELPMTIQTTFLRILETKKFRKVGGKAEEFSDFRLIAATNRNLEDLVQKKSFRGDLLFRIRAVEIHLPPLRSRIEDLQELCQHHMKSLSDNYGIEPKGFSPGFFELLSAYEWPGNIRELINALERAVVAAQEEPVLYPKHLPTNIRIQLARDSVDGDGDAPRTTSRKSKLVQAIPTLQETRNVALANLETNYLKELMSITAGNVKEACRLSGLSRSRLYALLKKYGLGKSG